MMNKQALAAVLTAAVAVQNAIAFAPSAFSVRQCPQRQTTLFESEAGADQQSEPTTTEVKVVEAAAAAPEDGEKLVMDIPPSPAVSSEEEEKPKPVAAKKKVPPKKKANTHKEGVFSPIVVAAGTVLGDKELNKIRGKIISIHSDLIKSFVGTSDSEFGQVVLAQLFDLFDDDNSGYLDKEEMAKSLSLLGFSWLKEKQVDKIFERADTNGDGKISREEFMEDCPKTLKMNLVKLAKKNGGDMGLLV